MLRARVVLPLTLALGLFTLNHLGVLSGWLDPPAGHVPLLRVDATDNSIYAAWLRSSESRVLHPNFQAPWQTDPTLFKPFLLLVARVSAALGLPLAWGWLLAHLGLYVAAAFALVAALHAFMKTKRERTAALVIMLLTVPIPGLLLLPSLVLPLYRVGIPWLPGLGYFVWGTSDAFLHGIAGSILVTYGTAATIAAFAFLAKYMETQRWRYLAGSCASVFLCGPVHPYEPFLISAAGCLALVIWRGAEWRRSLPEAALLGGAGAAGVAPMAIVALTTPWIRDAAEITKWEPPNPVMLLLMMGVPAIVACALFVPRRKMVSPTDLLLQCWVACTFVGMYIPFIPWTQHLMDGFHCGIAMLVVRQVVQTPVAGRVWRLHRGACVAAATALVILTVGALSAYYVQSFADGREPVPSRLFRSVVDEDDVAARDWLADNAKHTHLVLAPQKRATWFSSVPMHSFAGNVLFSITFEEQKRVSDDLYAGRLDQAAADRLFAEFGIRWVVVPEGSPARARLTRAVERARCGHWIIYEIEGNEMKPYPGKKR